MTVIGHGYDDNVGAPAFRNVIINGGMKVAQYGTSFSYASGGGTRYYPADRFNVENYVWSAGSNPTVSNDTTVYPPGGFRNSIKYQVGATGLTFSSGGWQSIMHRVEGYNIAHLYSSTVTLSFWVRSSVTGTYGVTFANDWWGTGSPTRMYIAEYTINAANTWEKKTITTSLATATTSYLAGVQLEAGSVATPFEFEPYETTLRKCQRYYFRWTPGPYGTIGIAPSYSTTGARLHMQLPVVMRATPTGITTGGSSFYQLPNGGGVVNCTLSNDRFNNLSILIGVTSTSMTAGGASMITGNQDGTSWIEVNGAEL